VGQESLSRVVCRRKFFPAAPTQWPFAFSCAVQLIGVPEPLPLGHLYVGISSLRLLIALLIINPASAAQKFSCWRSRIAARKNLFISFCNTSFFSEI